MSVNLDKLTRSLEQNDALERLNDLLFYLGLATNGFDGLGHYLRAGLVTNVCSSYATEPSSACRATFYDPAAEGSAAGAGQLEAANAEVDAQSGEGSVPPTGSLLQDLLGQGGNPDVARRREQNLEALQRRHEQGSSPALEGADPALDYLLGSDGP